MGGALKPRHLINLDGKHYTPQSNKDYGYCTRNYPMKKRKNISPGLRRWPMVKFCGFPREISAYTVLR